MNSSAYSQVEEFYINSAEGYVSIKMTLISPGTFIMGSPKDEIGRKYMDSDQKQVTITRPFYLGIYEVTQSQWKAIMGTNPTSYTFQSNWPVTSVSWDDCQEYIKRLNTMGIGTFRLPTEAEWEYACRAGSTTRFPWGHDPTYGFLGEYAWYKESVGNWKCPHTVGKLKPNAWGLYDMHGNVWEWCEDYNSGSCPVRGGSWYNYPEFCRSASRDTMTYWYKNDRVGFRLARDL